MSHLLAPDAVIIRMYKGILGDCFLLLLKKDGAPTTHILIDCGALQGTPNGGDKMRAVVDDIYATIGPQQLDLVIVTHEHHDHISGFASAKKAFEKHGFTKLWMAWTEDPADPDGIRYQEEFGEGFAILGMMAQHLKLNFGELDDNTQEALGLMGFSGTNLGAKQKDGKGTLRGSRAIYTNLQKWARDGIDFLSPGMVVPTTDDPTKPALRTYVLGPPRDVPSLKKAGHHKTDDIDTYLRLAKGEDAVPFVQGKAPFDKQYYWLKEAELKKEGTDGASIKDPLRRLTYDRYFAKEQPGQNHFAKGAQSHRILSDSTRADFSALALRMDNYTNNTSLVLAFELPNDAGIILFAADAQVGNWESWHKVTFTEGRDSPALPIKATDLLNRTCFYKVGHHGSRNATLKEGGLALMKGRDFVAMVPTDAEFAASQSGGWQMPNPLLEDALLEKGLVLRGDQPAASAIERHVASIADAADQKAARKRLNSAVNEKPLYIEYKVY